jgi:hypothetical protein
MMNNVNLFINFGVIIFYLCHFIRYSNLIYLNKDVTHVAALASCLQEIAGNGAFSLGMLADMSTISVCDRRDKGEKRGVEKLNNCCCRRLGPNIIQYFSGKLE